VPPTWEPVWWAFPENFSWMGPEAERTGAAETLEGPTLTRMAELARERRVTLLAGSILESGAPGGRLYNTTVLFGPDGARLAVYRKIHLFDVDVGDGTPYRESAAVAPGTEVVVADTELGRLGTLHLLRPALPPSSTAAGAPGWPPCSPCRRPSP
jgi:predicted amidohydrolase